MCGASCRSEGGGRVAGNGGASAQRRGPDCRLGAGQGEQRTLNMPYMLLTLDVSKLSGWLNADARRNMLCMVVTLDVSKLSGWLNAQAR